MLVVLSGPLVGAGVLLRAWFVCLPLPSVWPSSFYIVTNDDGKVLLIVVDLGPEKLSNILPCSGSSTQDVPVVSREIDLGTYAHFRKDNRWERCLLSKSCNLKTFAIVPKMLASMVIEKAGRGFSSERKRVTKYVRVCWSFPVWSFGITDLPFLLSPKNCGL
jgi:hypothetical protein